MLTSLKATLPSARALFVHIPAQSGSEVNDHVRRRRGVSRARSKKRLGRPPSLRPLGAVA
jgi:hypothetical protein